MADTVITSDIYSISESVDTLMKNYMNNVDTDVLVLGMYGYLNENLSKNLQNSILMAAEWANEYLPITAKFDKTILTNAILYDIENINAIPATIDIMVGFVEKDLKSQMVNGKFTLSKDCKLYIGDYEYHLDYDIIISSEEIAGEGTVYTSMYNMDRTNSLSDIDTPYITISPIRLIQDNDTFIFITCIARQLSIESSYQKIISNNILENKTVDFNFTSQMAGFIVKIINSDSSIDYLEAIYEGMPDSNNKYCYYNYLDEDTIRIKFDTDSYDPELNSTVQIDLITTTGTDGNFLYTADCLNVLDCESINYNNLSVMIKPISASRNGYNKKSIKELQQILPKEILARGSIINNKDLQNFFNNIDADNRLVFDKKIDNQIQRLYYAYLLAKDSNDNIIPTNTLDIQVDESEISLSDNNRYIISPGTSIVYNKDSSYAIVSKNDLSNEENNFIYSSPFIISINKNPLSVSYYLDVINNDYRLKFDYINQNSFLQFVAANLNCKRIYLEGSTYKITTTITQNVNIDKNLITIDANGEILTCNIKPILVLKVNNNNAYYVEGKIVSYNSSVYSYGVEFELDSDSTLDVNNNIKIQDVFTANSTTKTDIYLPDTIDTSIYIYTKFDQVYGKNDENIVPGIEDYSLCNIYSTISGIALFYNYSSNIRSNISISGTRDEVKGYTFNITGVPLFRKSYIDNIDRCNNCIEYIQYRKAYIDKALETLEGSFNVDLKFFNTYGPSKVFEIGYDGTKLDKVNLTLNFRTKLKTGASESIIANLKKAIKIYIENLNTIVTSIHMSNLTTELKTTYDSEIEFIEFIGFNNYDALLQYIAKNTTTDINTVPEFLCVNLIDGESSDINITTV